MTTTNATAIEIRPSFESQLVETLTYGKRKIEPSYQGNVLEFVNRQVSHFIKMGYSLNEISAEVSLRRVNTYLGGGRVDGYLDVKVSTRHSSFEDYFHFSYCFDTKYTKTQNEMIEAILEQVKEYQEAKDAQEAAAQVEDGDEE